MDSSCSRPETCGQVSQHVKEVYDSIEWRDLFFKLSSYYLLKKDFDQRVGVDSGLIFGRRLVDIMTSGGGGGGGIFVVFHCPSRKICVFYIDKDTITSF
jgi:hypothetical protein